MARGGAPQTLGKPTTQTKYFPFNGGLDIVTPALSVDPGFALAMVNYEPWFNGGYRRVDGYERFDGHAKPSAATFSAATMSSLAGLVIGTSTGSLGTGSISGAKAQFVESVTVSGTNYVALTNGTGTFGIGDKIIIGAGTSVGTLTSVPSVGFAPTGTGTSGYIYSSEFMERAQNYYRQQISAVPGTGNILGAWQNQSNIYAIRGTGTSGTNAALLYKSTGTGWTTAGITYTATMYFASLGTAGLPANGVVVTGGVSGATGTLYSGITHTPTAGYLALTGVTGTFGTSEALKVAGVTFGTSASAATLFSLPAGGNYKYRFKNYNFFATALTYYTYAVNGQGAAIQIDNNNVVMPILMPLNPLTSQPAVNNPFLLEVHLSTLYLAFPGGVYQASVPGQPTQFNGFLGANQFSTGAEITGLFSITGPALILQTQRNTQALTGTSSATFQQAFAAEKAGAVLNGGQLLDTVYGLNNLGITSLSRTQSYGNFVGATISQLVQPLVAAERPNFVDSAIVRSSNEARFYFNDNSFLIMYVPGLGQQNKAWSAIETGVTAQFGYASYNVPVFCIYSSEDVLNAEVRYFGSSNGDGYVYQDGIGQSFDGVAVTSYLRLVFNNVGSPVARKFFRRVDVELNATSQLALKFAADLSYSNSESTSAVAGITASDIAVSNVFAGGGYWDSINWNQFNWDGQAISTARAQGPFGTGENISFLIFHQAIVDTPFVLQGAVLHYDTRRLQR